MAQRNGNECNSSPYWRAWWRRRCPRGPWPLCPRRRCRRLASSRSRSTRRRRRWSPPTGAAGGVPAIMPQPAGAALARRRRWRRCPSRRRPWRRWLPDAARGDAARGVAAQSTLQARCRPASSVAVKPDRWHRQLRSRLRLSRQVVAAPAPIAVAAPPATAGDPGASTQIIASVASDRGPDADSCASGRTASASAGQCRLGSDRYEAARCG